MQCLLAFCCALIAGMALGVLILVLRYGLQKQQPEMQEIEDEPDNADELEK